MTMTELERSVRADLLESLAEDGDTVELENGRALRLRVQSDECDVMDLWSDDCYGRIAFVSGRTNVYGYPQDRPEGFDGNAEKLSYGRGDDAWWQPPADIKRGTEQFQTCRRVVRDLLEFGFYSVGLELLDGTDAYGRPIVVNAAWLGGLEPMNYRAWQDCLQNDVLPDLLSEVLS